MIFPRYRSSCRTLFTTGLGGNTEAHGGTILVLRGEFARNWHTQVVQVLRRSYIVLLKSQVLTKLRKLSY